MALKARRWIIAASLSKSRPSGATVGLQRHVHIPRFCGDGVCLGDETLASCPADCGGERLEVYEGCQAALTFSVDGVEVASETIDLGDEAPYHTLRPGFAMAGAAVPRVPTVWGSTACACRGPRRDHLGLGL